MMQDKYKHIDAEDATVTVDITAAEMAAILATYDYGIRHRQNQPASLNSVIDNNKTPIVGIGFYPVLRRVNCHDGLGPQPF